MSDSDEAADDEGVVLGDDEKPRFRTIAVEKSARSDDE